MSAFDSDSDIEINNLIDNKFKLNDEDAIYNLGKYKGENKTIGWLVVNNKKYCLFVIKNYKYPDNIIYKQLVKVYNKHYKTNY